LTSEWPRACGIEFYLVKRFERARFSLQWKNPRLAGFTHTIFTRLAHFFSTCVRRVTSGTWDAETDFCPENRTSGLCSRSPLDVQKFLRIGFFVASNFTVLSDT